MVDGTLPNSGVGNLPPATGPGSSPEDQFAAFAAISDAATDAAHAANAPATDKPAKVDAPLETGSEDHAGGPAADAPLLDTQVVPPPEGATQTVDWSKLPAEAKQQYDAATAELGRIATEARNQRRQLGRVARPTLSPQAAALMAPAQAPATDGKSVAPPRITESAEFKTAEADYPEIVKPLRIALESTQSDLEALMEVTRQTVGTRNADFYAQQAADLEARVPDYRQLVAPGPNARAFGEWATRQPQYVQELIAKNGAEIEDVEAAHDVMTRYKRDLTDAARRVNGGARPADTSAAHSPDAALRQRQLDGSAAATSRSGKSTRASLPDDPEKLFEFYANAK